MKTARGTKKKGAEYLGNASGIDAVSLDGVTLYFQNGAYSHALQNGKGLQPQATQIAEAARALPNKPESTSNLMLGDKPASFVPRGVPWRGANGVNTTPVRPEAAVRKRAVYIGQRDHNGQTEAAFLDGESGGVYLQRCDACAVRGRAGAKAKTPKKKR